MSLISVYLHRETNGYIGENQKHLQHDDNDDARFQLLQNPITYRDCDTTENINFKIEPKMNKQIEVMQLLMNGRIKKAS